MKLSQEELAEIRTSMAALKAKIEPASTSFYEKLFVIAPEIRGMFRADISEQGMRFMSTLALIVDCIDHEDELNPKIDRLAEGHAAYGVKPEHFEPMGRALMETMEAELGDKLTSAQKAAWRQAYAVIAHKMIEAANR